MKVMIEFDPADPEGLGNAYRVLNAFKGAGATAEAPKGPAAPPPASTPPAPPAGAAPPPPPASAPPPAAQTAAPPPPPPASGVSAAQFGAQVQNYAKAYKPAAAKARFAELSAAWGVNYTKTSDVPPERFEEAMAWFAVA